MLILKGHQKDDPKIRKALEELEEPAAYIKILGSYPDETKWRHS